MSEIDYSSLTNALNLARKALEFYANEKTYARTQMTTMIDLDHHGHQARYAIETIDMVLNPDHSKEEEREYNEALLAQQQMYMEESIKNMTIMADDTKIQYDTLLKSGKFFEKFPDLSGDWELDKDEFIKKLYE
jgi:hypothetical protein